MFELLTNEEMGEADRRTIASGTTGQTLMENAGDAVAQAVMARHPPGTKVAVVAGTGNNGGDGFVAARRLREAGYRVETFLIGHAENVHGDAATAMWGWGGPIAAAPDLAGTGVILDALFGAGLNRPITGDSLAAIEAMNCAEVPVVAIDFPSGINGTTGVVHGAAVRAAATITFFRKKPGHLLMPGRIFCGTITVSQIGIQDQVLSHIKPAAHENNPDLWRAKWPVPAVEGHKYGRGHVVVVSGGLAHTGAARLAAMAALRGGAGLVTVASPRDALIVHAVANLAVMVRPVDTAAELEVMLADRRFNAVLLGPGGGVGLRTREMVLATLAAERGVVLDADALTSFADCSLMLFTALGQHGNAVLTPHAGEFHRLFGKPLENTPAATASKLAATSAAARLCGAVVVHKGADTVIAAPDGRAAINANAPPWLATAGTGDVLAGLITGLLAQGMPPFEAAAAAVWVHGKAAQAAGPGLISEDLALRFAEVYRRLRP